MEGERRARGDWLFRNGDVCVVAEYSIEIEEREREREYRAWYTDRKGAIPLSGGCSQLVKDDSR